MNKQGPFYGKYRGTITDNLDPKRLGRVRAKVHDVLGGKESGWALPSVPYAGKDVGFFFIPPVNASVWIEFEHGNPDYPIWTGCFWMPDGVNEVPGTGVAGIHMLKTDVCTVTLNDLPGEGGFTLEVKVGPQTMQIDMDASGIAISTGQAGQGASIKLGPKQVSINDGALEVT